MSYSLRSYRHRNPKPEDKQQPSSFFSHANRGTIHAKRETPFFQAKLRVNDPGDQYEQEADAVANRITNPSSPATEGGSIQRKKISQIQRLSSSKEDEKLGTNEQRMRRDKEIQAKPDVQLMGNAEEKQEKEKNIQMKSQEEERDEMKGGGMMQMKSESGTAGTASQGLSARIEGSAGKGKTLPREMMGHMSSSFGLDFSDVNIHTDNESAEMNKELGAQAFTHGKDIYFNKGKFDPESVQGKKLLAHELTHVVQQSSSGDKSSE